MAGVILSKTKFIGPPIMSWDNFEDSRSEIKEYLKNKPPKLIYRFINKINGKVYCGSTTVGLRFAFLILRIILNNNNLLLPY